ncbi:FUSC family membrane protein [Segetibacter koreensis]|uniref:FUSC family membrane protein n=1 Tax=Segetibacter koreensis TaxID=398037 RepID=UPI000361BBE0|nr:FUSC family membrane protein [Segetibacter koreensis]
MDYLKTYKSFINSQHLSEGVRITTGVLLPAFIMSYFHMLSTGISISLGALFVSITDSAGPIHHRKNGMIVCIVSIFLVSLCAGFFTNYPVVLALFLFACCFFFSMIGIYGTRASSIGTATLIVLTLSTDNRLNLTTATQIIQHSFLIASGGLWYMCFSMLLYSFRPYRLAQQALGDCIQSIAEYLEIRSELYNKHINYKSTYRQLLLQQAIVQHKQTEITELLFKTRSIVKESTNIGRRLVMIYLDAADIFERIMMSHQEYARLHQYFDETDILNDYYLLAKELAKNLNEVGIAVKSGDRYNSDNDLREQIVTTREKLDNLRLTYLKPDNIDGFISLRRILENIQDLSDRLTTLEKYTYSENRLKKRIVTDSGYEKMISSQEITSRIFFDNLTFKSDTFRHSMRVSIAVMAGFLVTQLFKIGHSYWILLTIIVILKPAFSLTKKRNRDRIAGTLAGIIIGVAILLTTNNSVVLLVLLILFMTASYTFMRTNYFVSVLLMTPYLLLFYHLLNPLDFKILLKDRLLDTLIGSSIAFIASIFLFPSWERKKIKPVMTDMLLEAKEYFSVIAAEFSGKTITPSAQKVARKNALVALANLSDAFNRMLSEPKTQQKGVEMLHQFVVLTHTLTSYIATLSYYIQMQIIPYNSDDFEKVIEDIEDNFTNAINCLNNKDVTIKNINEHDSLRILNERANALLQKRRNELEQGFLETSTRKQLFDLKSFVDQFNLIYNVAADLNKTTQKLAPSLKSEE